MRSMLPSRPRLIALAAAVLVGLAALAFGVLPPSAAPVIPAYAATELPADAETLWGADRPPGVRSAIDPKSVELGTAFTPEVDGRVIGVRYWKNTESAAENVGNLWADDGSLLASAPFEGQSEDGWQTVQFSKPVEVSGDNLYVASYFAPDGQYSATVDYEGAGTSDLISVESTSSGLYAYGDESAHPTSTWRSTQYWVDVLFVPADESGPQPSPEPVLPAPPPEEPEPRRDTNCAAEPSACGYPDASNTGPAAGTTLVKVPQERTSGTGWLYDERFERVWVTGPSATLNGLDIEGSVVIDAPGVTLSNSRVRTCGASIDVVALRVQEQNGFEGRDATIIDNELIGLPEGCSERARSGVRDVYGAVTGALVDGNDISGTGNGVTIEYEGVVENNWYHDLGHLAGDHHSGISTHGGSKSVTIRHNTVLLGYGELPGGGGVSGAIVAYSDFGQAQNVTVEDNLISGGSYTVYGGDSGASTTGQTTNIKFLDNRFVCDGWLYGPVAAFNRKDPGNEWSGNVCDSNSNFVQP